MPPLRVLVVEDSLTVRRRLCEVLSSDPAIVVVGEAKDGREAIDLCHRLRPDVMTMDIVLPGLTGLDATEHIMAHFPTPILIVSSSMNRGEVFKTYEALAAGAVDVLDKPRGDEGDGEWERRFLATLKLVARIPVITHPRARLTPNGRRRLESVTSSTPNLVQTRGAYEILVIGASTGGPGAIREVMEGLTVPFPLPILFVLHIGEAFGASFAEWLDSLIGMKVSYARDGELIKATAGRVTMAPPDAHLVTRNGRMYLTRDPPRHSCRPSIDLLFESVARDFGARAMAALLTGMGRDGAEGLLRVRRAGGFTVAQDEATSVVYGMPREAAKLGAAERQLPLGEIGPALAAMAARPREDGQP